MQFVRLSYVVGTIQAGVPNGTRSELFPARFRTFRA